MATPIQQAGIQLNPLFNAAAGAIQAQIPDVQQLYDTLIQGLQGQQNTQLQNVLASAQQRGVSSAGLEAGAQDALSGAYSQATAPVALQNVQNISGLRQNIGQSNVNRGTNIVALSDTLNSQALEAAKNRQALQVLNQNAQLEMQKNQQDFNVREAQYRVSQARAAAAAQSKAQTAALNGLADQLGVDLKSQVGGDGKVSNENYSLAKAKWLAAGGDETAFNAKFLNYVNLDYKDLYLHDKVSQIWNSKTMTVNQIKNALGLEQKRLETITKPKPAPKPAPKPTPKPQPKLSSTTKVKSTNPAVQPFDFNSLLR